MTTLVDLLLHILFPTLLLGLLGYLLLSRKFVLGKRLIGAMLLVLTILSMPAVPRQLLYWLESPPAINLATSPPQAIVILGAGVAIAREYGGYSVGSNTLLRIRYGAELARRSGLPILLSGGRPGNTPHSEAWYMRKVMTEEFSRPVRWIEEESVNTAEGGANSAALLKQENIRTVYLVTNASHMARARAIFEAAGIDVVPAATVLTGPVGWAYWQSYVPKAASLVQMHEFLHEVIGLAVFRMKN